MKYHYPKLYPRDGWLVIHVHKLEKHLILMIHGWIPKLSNIFHTSNILINCLTYLIDISEALSLSL